MNVSFERKIFIVFAFLFSATVLVGYFTFKASEKYKETDVLAKHTAEVFYQSEKIVSALRNIESGNRGFVITGDTSFSKWDTANYSKLLADIGKLKSLTKKNAKQQARIDTLKSLVHSRLILLNVVFQLAKLHSTPTLGMIDYIKKGQAYTYKVSRLITTIQEAETQLLKEREQENNTIINQFYNTLYALLACNSFLFVAVFWFIKTYLQFRQQKEADLAYAKVFLETLNSLTCIGNWEINLLTGNNFFSNIASSVYEIPPFYKLSLKEMIGFYKEGANRDLLENAIAKAIKNGIAFDLQLQVISFKGNEKWVEIKCVAEFSNGKCKRLYGTLQDIDSKKKRENIIIENEALLSNVYDNAPVMIGVVELTEDDVFYVKVNKCVTDFLGISEAEIANRYASEMGASKEVIAKWIERYKEAEATGKPVHFEHERIDEHGTRYLKSIASYLGETIDGKKRYAYIIDDITSVKKQ
ncbi:CHASE3 domain-containing protein [Parasediminibacterium sp. JCM 36343]|uniref:CHASE3 domain-containing protein n=1 Tax=Parasediminibacterium sp. JCM 36343 TaxID=3374279 RepID=UPI00397AA71E